MMYPISQSVLCFCYFLLFSAKNSLTIAANETNSSEVTLNRCKDFVWDFWDSYENNSLPIPGLITEDRKNTHFRLTENDVELECSDGDIKAVILLTSKTIDTQIRLNDSNIDVANNTNSTKVNKSAKLRGEIYDHFTKDGFLMINSVYYDPHNFCIANFTDSAIGVKMCQKHCPMSQTRTQKKTAHRDRGCVNIPKCCGLNQELIFWNFTCQNSQRNIWSPDFYSDPDNSTRLSKEAGPEIMYSRPLLKCSKWEPWPRNVVKRPRKVKSPPHVKLNWRLLSDGSIVYRNEHGKEPEKWIPIPKGDFCMDGFANWGLGGDGHYSGLAEDQVILLCPDEPPPVMETIKVWIPYLYAGFLFGSSLFLLLTVIVHIALFEKLQLHGLTVLSHSVSMFLMYIFLGLAYLTSAMAIDYQDSGIKILGSYSCTAIGIFAHFFFLSTFSWLTIMNADLWWTFRTVKPLGSISERMKRFKIYTVIGWGIPLTLISTFVGLDFSKSRESTNDPDSKPKFITPDYGIKSCFVAGDSRGAYIYYILAILISVNVIFIVSTCLTFIRFQRNNKSISSKKTAKCDKYSFKLFAKLFFIMGVAWCFELYSWMQDPSSYNPSWHIIILDFIMFFQAAGNFVIFCCNPRTLSQLEDKFPQYKKALRLAKKLFCVKSYPTTGDGFDLANRSASGGTMRKMSTTISQSMQTDQTS